MNADRTDERLRAILRMEADTVESSPTGWDAIRSGVAARRRRAWWLGGPALVAVALTVGAVVFVVDLTASRRSLNPVASPSVSTSPPSSASPSATPTAAVPADPTPIGAIWPLTTKAEVAAWQADRATYPSLATPRGSALGFARNYLGIADASVVMRNTLGPIHTVFDVTRPVNGATAVVTTLDVVDFGQPASGPWVVTAARSDAIAIDRPGAVSSPFAAHGTYRAVDPAFTVTLRADGSGSAPVDLASGRAVTGPPNVWDCTLSFTTAARTGSLLVTDRSLADGGLAAAAAVPVTFGPFR
ncbi:MAG: hypothetical protein QOE45_2679 [Frankiaceae bacterium]|jgi:hypothetical protein|nr:hypothetical protein [Frankiaceae bacterium]